MPRHAVAFVGVVALASIAALAACGGDPVATSQMSISTINIYDFYYMPAAVTVHVGTTVEWVNHGPSAHTATSDDGVWDSGSIAAPTSGGGGTPPPTNPPPSPGPYSRILHADATTFSTVFNTAGVFRFHCSLHPPSAYPDFVGSVTVTP